MKKDNLFNNNSPIVAAIMDAYQTGQEDEALEPIVAVDSDGNPVGRIQEEDSIIFYNIRGEREIQLTKCLTVEGFNHFPVQNLRLNFVTMIGYNSHLPVKVAFPPEGPVKNTFTEVVSNAGKKIVKISESEKAVHVGFFMNGKKDDTFQNEERIVVQSPQNVASYDIVPEMSAGKVTEEILDKIKDPAYPVVVANFANVDVVGHIENQGAVLKAIEAVDHELGKVIEACSKHKATLVVTADHGTVEEWYYPDGTIDTGHTKNPVPFIIADFSSTSIQIPDLEREGELTDVAPTLLDMLAIKKPLEMTGTSLLKNKAGKATPKEKLVVLILDGWGIREENHGNMIALAKTPNFDNLLAEFPHALLKSSGKAVGMPEETVGNSEAGHLHLGAGRRILLDRVKIDEAIKNGEFYRNKAFRWAMENAAKENRALHLLGIVSHYSSHGSISHLFALLRMAKEMGLKRVYVHALIGRRGEKPESGAIYVSKVEEMCHALSIGCVVTVIGRYWALDREDNWDRTEKTYRALVYGDGVKIKT
ncbi:MAG: alkaline phosphatase family protein [Acidobacteriota bacterium]|nr:alkaline phosphatase family protein [Acidobacteriota bacterium]